MEIDNQRVVYLVLLDLSAAFDTVDHGQLLQRMKTVYGIDDQVLSWFQSYLSDRSQKGSVESELSKVCDLLCGVTQGYGLGG